MFFMRVRIHFRKSIFIVGGLPGNIIIIRYLCKDMKKETIQNAGANVLIQGHRCYRCNHEWKPNNMQKTPRVCPKCKSPYWDKHRTNGSAR